VIPGLILIWGSVLVWALLEQEVMGWLIFGLATVLTIIGTVVKIVWPGRRLREAGIPGRSVVAGAVLSIVGIFVVPLLGFVIGFVLGVYLAERYRLGTHALAWPSTTAALKAAGLSIAIELVAGLWIAGSWAITVLFLT
jgi:hypothetical protein